MESEKRKKKRRSKRRVKIYKTESKRSPQRLSNDEVRSIDKKKRNKKRKRRKNLAALILTLLVFCIGIVLVFSLFFKISTVTVEGESIYPDKMIVQKSGIEIGTNLFRVKEDELSEEISKSLPYIKSATVKRKLPDTLVIEVTPTKETAAVSSNGSYILIDETGKVVDTDASVLSESVAVVSGVKVKKATEGSKIVLTDSKKTSALIELLTSIKKSKTAMITEIDLKNVSDIKMKYDSRITLEVGSLTNIDTKLARAEAAIERENEINAYSTGVLDLKTDPYAFFKAGSEKTTAAKKKTKKDNKNTTKTETTTEGTTVNPDDLPAAH